MTTAPDLPHAGARGVRVQVSVDDVHLGRQPVFDRPGTVVGYRLLFRAPAGPGASPEDRDRATADVLVRTFADFGLEAVVGDRTAFVELPRAALVGRDPLPFPAENVVLQLPPDVLVDEAVLAGLRRLAAKEFRLAVDASAYRRHGEALAGLVDVVTVEGPRLESPDLPALAAQLRPSGVHLAAQGVTTAAQLTACRDLDVAWCSGDLLSRPTLLCRRTLDSSASACLRLLTALSSRDYDVAEVDAALRADPGLSLRVLRAVNASATGLRSRVRSVRQAVLLLGSRTLLGWVALITLASGTAADAEAVAAALARGRMCELLAPRVHADGETAFTVGLLSGLQPLLGVPLPAALAELPLHPDVVAAAVDHAGPLGAVLADVLAYERGDAASLLSTTLLRETYVAALGWARDVLAGAPRSP